jgi:hypothetical protein
MRMGRSALGWGWISLSVKRVRSTLGILHFEPPKDIFDIYEIKKAQLPNPVVRVYAVNTFNLTDQPLTNPRKRTGPDWPPNISSLTTSFSRYPSCTNLSASIIFATNYSPI